MREPLNCANLCVRLTCINFIHARRSGGDGSAERRSWRCSATRRARVR